MGYAFISYSTKNQQPADAVRAIFNKEGIDTWMAPYDIPPGSEYADILNKALKGCSCFVLLLTEDSQSSKHVAKEVDRAINFGKLIIPVQFESIVLNDKFDYYLCDTQIVSVPRISLSCEAFVRVL